MKRLTWLLFLVRPNQDHKNWYLYFQSDKVWIEQLCAQHRPYFYFFNLWLDTVKAGLHWYFLFKTPNASEVIAFVWLWSNNFFSIIVPLIVLHTRENDFYISLRIPFSKNRDNEAPTRVVVGKRECGSLKQFNEQKCKYKSLQAISQQTNDLNTVFAMFCAARILRSFKKPGFLLMASPTFEAVKEITHFGKCWIIKTKELTFVILKLWWYIDSHESIIYTSWHSAYSHTNAGHCFSFLFASLSCGCATATGKDSSAPMEIIDNTFQTTRRRIACWESNRESTTFRWQTQGSTTELLPPLNTSIPKKGQVVFKLEYLVLL